MELTIEQREEYNEYHRNYRKNNPEKFKKYREDRKDYQHNYYIQNYENIRLQQKGYRDNNLKFDAVYFFMFNEEISYIGSSARFKERMSAHCCGDSNLKMSAEEMVQAKLLNKILYKDFNEYNLNRADLYFIEQYEKDRNCNNEILGKNNKVPYKEENLSRSKEELIKIANEIEFKEFDKLDRYLN
ncbi:hypothetical protein CLPUN_08140 [Clostridium puniceum]|uniref:GIY-YIG domain-containing protein n=1 Tax=Clostridium puniceum TaxID=29367 RepID=A0A1S8TVR8_9CLOT|nr:hypothetical protein [Clostridium puniceum]OOM81836.1 hypothetical protein CLPUN_08140 [Clostridium puniceum]